MVKTKSAPLSTDGPKYRQLPGLWFGLICLIVAAILFSGPLWASSDQLRSVVNFLSLLALAQMWNLLAGYAGMVSIGQQGWIGLGGYTLIVFADDLGQPLALGMVAAGIVCGLVAIPTAALLFRLRGGYFSIGTWVVAEIFRLLVTNNTDWLRGGNGRTLNVIGLGLDRDTREILTYLFAVVIGLGSMALVYWLMRSRGGLALTAIRDSEIAAASLGVSTRRMKLGVYVLCAFGTGVTGALIYFNLLRITPDAAFSVQYTAFMIFIVVIGGIGTIEGPIIGTVVFYFIREYLTDFGEWSIILLGVIAIVIVLFLPEGIWGWVQRRFNLEFFPVRRWLRTAEVTDQLPETVEQSH